MFLYVEHLDKIDLIINYYTFIIKMDIDEYECLQQCTKQKIYDMSTLIACDERYWRYLKKISYWMDESGNNYEYVRDKVWEFVNLANTFGNFDVKVKMMKYIDGEILMMMSLCLMRDMGI